MCKAACQKFVVQYCFVKDITTVAVELRFMRLRSQSLCVTVLINWIMNLSLLTEVAMKTYQV